MPKSIQRSYDPSAWEDSYLPVSEEDFAEVPVPRPPMVLEFPTSRAASPHSVAGYRVGTEPNWMQDEFRKTDSPSNSSTLLPPPSAASPDSGLRITESVIYRTSTAWTRDEAVVEDRR